MVGEKMCISGIISRGADFRDEDNQKSLCKDKPGT